VFRCLYFIRSVIELLHTFGSYLNRYKEIKIIEEVSVKTQMNKIHCLEKGFMAAHLINIGAKIRSIRKTE